MEQKYTGILAWEQALQRIVEGAPHTQHFFSVCELMASRRVSLAVEAARLRLPMLMRSRRR